MESKRWLASAVVSSLTVIEPLLAAAPHFLPGQSEGIARAEAQGSSARSSEPEEAAGGAELSYRPGEGLELRDRQGRFELLLGNRIQARYAYADPSGGSPTSAFTVRRFKTFAKGSAYRPWLRYKLQVNWVGARAASGERLPDLEDALIDAAFSRAASVQAGQFKVPFNRQELTSSGAQQFVDRAITNDRFAFDRDRGLMLHGAWAAGNGARIEYQAAVLDGSGKNRASAGTEPLIAARVQWLPLGPLPYSESDLEFSRAPRLALGAAFARKPSQPAPGQPAFERATADGHLQWRGFSFASDFFLEQPEGQRRGSTPGALVQAGWFVVPGRFEIAGRYAVYNPPGGRNRREEVRGGINAFFAGHSWKLQLDAGAVTGEKPGAAALGDAEVRLQGQVIF